MKPYRLRKYITGTGVLLAGAGLLSAPALADDSGPSARPARQESSRGAGPAARPAPRSAPSPATPAWRGPSRGASEGSRAFGGGIVPSRPSPFTPGSPGNAPRPSPFADGRNNAPSPFPAGPVRTPSPVGTGRNDAPSPFNRGGENRPTPFGNRQDAPTWRSGGETNAGRGPQAPARPAEANRPQRGTVPSPMPGRAPDTTRDTPNRFGDRGGNSRPSPDSPLGWRPPSRGGDTSTKAPPSAPRIPRPDNRFGNPNERATNPYERRDNPNEIGGPSWRVTPGRVTVIDPAMHHRPPQVDRSRWSGTDGIRYGGRNFHRVTVGYVDPWWVYQTPVFTGIRFYYPFYYVGPFQAGFYYSPFWTYGTLFPTYIYPERVIVVERRTYIRDVVPDDGFYDPYSSSTTTLRDTMADIRSAWVDGDGGLLLRHINDAFPVRILQKGSYKYSLEPDDYRDITKDALNRVQTVSFDWTNVDRQKDDVVVLEARHTFRDQDGDRHTIRLTYTVEKARGSWWITQTDVAPW